MRFRTIPVALVAAFALAACVSDGTNDDPRASPAPAPATVTCQDSAQLKQWAVDDRRYADGRKSDHEKIYIGNRASFFASLANIADLKCKVTLAAADEALKPAIEAARKAEATSSMYERAQRWSEADFMASQVIAQLIQQLPTAPPK